jgi:zinc transport system permease protein
LFGSILGIRTTELWGLGAVAVAVVAFLAAAWGQLTLMTFDRELAQASGIAVGRLDAAFFASASLAIVASVKLVGIVLVSSFFVVPAATARLLGATFARVTVLSAALGTATAVAGLLLSYPLQAPVGALIVLVQAGLFGTVAGLRRIWGGD